MKGDVVLEFYRKVTSKQYSNGKAPANMAMFAKEDRARKAAKAAEEKAALESAMRNATIEREIASREAANRIVFEGLKRRIGEELSRYVPILVMNEFFSRVVINALPHDEEYIEECRESIITVNKVYLHHLGGLKYLKEQAQKTNSSLLNKLYRLVKENTDIVLKDKLDELHAARTEDEVNAVLRNGITADQAEKIDNDIDSLDPEEIAELVQNKVLDVVKDESRRQAEDNAFKASLQQRAADYKDQANKELNPGVTDANAADNDEEFNSDEGQEVQEEEPKTESAKLAAYLVDPTVLHETSLFNSLMVRNYRDMIKAVSESEEITNISNQPQTVPKVPLQVATSPLNLNMFDVYLNDYQDDLKHVDNLRIANKKPLAGSETRIDVEDVLAESLIQYTMLESAMTIKLITPTVKEVRAVAEYNMRYK